MLGKSKNIWSSGEKQKQVVLVQAFLKASPCRQLSHMLPFCAFDLRESQMCQSSRALERLMVVYFGNVIHSVSPYLNERPTWVCISLNSLGPISDRACYRLIHRHIQDAGGFCSSNAKHLTSAHHSYASSDRDRVSSENKMRQRSDKTRK